jgi:hypothetical protein
MRYLFDLISEVQIHSFFLSGSRVSPRGTRFSVFGEISGISAEKKTVVMAIKQMPSDKASRPDDFTVVFFKKCWGIIKDDVMGAIHQFKQPPCCPPPMVEFGQHSVLANKGGGQGDLRV